MKGQAGVELLAIVVVIFLFFTSAYIGVIKREADLAEYRRSVELQNTVDRVASYMSAAQITEGLHFNASLTLRTVVPFFIEGCTPVYTVYTRLLIATCGSNAYTAIHLAANATNGTSQPPFVIGGNVTIQNNAGIVKVLSS